jgi:peptidyl-prolyl cis-trans isomerase SurA
VRFVVVFLLLVAAPPLFARETASLLPTEGIWGEGYVNGVVAVVNDRVITAGELRQELFPLLAHGLGEGGSEALHVAAREALERLIERALLVGEFEKTGQRMTKTQLGFQLDEFIRSRFQGDRSLFMEQLHAHGKTLQQFQREMEEEIIVGWMLGRLRESRMEHSPGEVADYYTAHGKEFYQPPSLCLGQIRFPSFSADGTTPNPDIGLAMERLGKGEDFESVALAFGKYLGERSWMPQGNLPESWRDALAGIPVGGYTAPIRQGEETSILCLFEREEGRQLGLEEVRDRVEERLFEQKISETRARWLGELRRNAHIGIYL